MPEPPVKPKMYFVSISRWKGSLSCAFDAELTAIEDGATNIIAHTR